jgi:hypothetical protein
VVGISVEHDAGVRPNPDPAGFCRRQVDVHINIGGVEHRKHLAASRQYLADIGDAAFDRAIAWRNEGILEDVDPIKFDVVGDGVERVLRLTNPMGRGIFRRDSALFIC